MAAKKSAQNPHKWPDGTWHSIPWAETKRGQAAAQRVASPPSGYYDPNLDAQERAETRGYENTIDDITTGRERAGIDLGISTELANRSKTRNQQDYESAKAGVERGSGRSLSDLLLNRERGGEDYRTSLANLQRQYQRLGNVQGEQARKAGAEATGGAYAQAARKRAANQALDKSPIDLAYQRFMKDSQTSETRLGEDKKTSLDDLLRGYTRGTEDIDTSIGQTGLSYDRTMADFLTNETRAGDEHVAFGQDIDTARQMQWGGQAFTGAGTPVADPFKPKPTPTTSGPPKGLQTLGAGPGYPNSKKRKKGRTITYTAQAGAP